MDIDDNSELSKINSSSSEHLADKMEIDEIDSAQLLNNSAKAVILGNNSNDRTKIYIEQLIECTLGIRLRSNSLFSEEFHNLDFLNDFSILNLVQSILMSTLNSLNEKEYDSANKLLSQIDKARSESTLSSYHDNLGTSFRYANEISTFKDTSVLLLRYLMDCYFLIESEEKINKTKDFISRLLSEMKEQCVNYAILLLTNKFSFKEPFLNSPLFPFVIYQSAPQGFIPQIITNTFNDGGITGDFSTIFQPLLNHIWLEMQNKCSITFDEQFMLPVRALVELCDIRVGSNRPICELLVQLENWLPDELTNNSAGKEFSRACFISPFMRISVFAEDDMKVVDKFFKEETSEENFRLINQTLQGIKNFVIFWILF